MRLTLNWLMYIHIITILLLKLWCIDAVSICQLCQAQEAINCGQGHEFCKACSWKNNRLAKYFYAESLDKDKTVLKEYTNLIHAVPLTQHDAQPPSSSLVPLRTEIQTSSEKKICECCFGNDALIACPDGHGLCGMCIMMESDEQLAGNRDPVTASHTEMKCPGVGCSLILPESTVQKALGSGYARRQARLQQRLNAQLNNRCKMCGGEGLIIRNIGPDLLCDLIQCKSSECGALCCAECGEHVQRNHKCTNKKKYETWLELLMHSTPCCHCRSFAQKMNGCNHLCCKTCGTHFCYVCGGETNRLYFHICTTPIRNYRERAIRYQRVCKILLEALFWTSYIAIWYCLGRHFSRF